MFIKKPLGKNQLIYRKYGGEWGITMVFKLVRKTIFEQIYSFCVIICCYFC